MLVVFSTLFFSAAHYLVGEEVRVIGSSRSDHLDSREHGRLGIHPLWTLWNQSFSHVSLIYAIYAKKFENIFVNRFIFRWSVFSPWRASCQSVGGTRCHQKIWLGFREKKKIIEHTSMHVRLKNSSCILSFIFQWFVISMSSITSGQSFNLYKFILRSQTTVHITIDWAPNWSSHSHKGNTGSARMGSSLGRCRTFKRVVAKSLGSRSTTLWQSHRFKSSSIYIIIASLSHTYFL